MPEITFTDDCALNQRERTEVSKLINEAAERMAPQLLRVDVGSIQADVGDGDTRYAGCAPNQAGRSATIFLSQAWRDSTPEYRRTVIYHEVMHVVMSPMCQTFAYLQQQADEYVAQVSEHHFRDALEGTIEDLVAALL